jgi:hypothetical protein
MSNTKIKSFLPIPHFSDDESKKSVPVKDTVSIYASRVPQGAISPVPTHNAAYGRLTPAPERLTPTGQGRVKIPPLCMASSLREEASSIIDFSVVGVCFSPREAELCAEKAFILDGNLDKGNHARYNEDEMPLNIGKCLGFSSTSSAESTVGTAALHSPSTLVGNDAHEFVSSSSSLVSTLSCGQSASCGKVTSVAKKNEVSSNSSVILENGDLLGNRGDASVAVEQTRFGSGHGEKIGTAEIEQRSTAQLSPRTASLSTFASNLVKVKSSRQGRSLQRWLVHSPTGELVRQVAGTIPITRDGLIVLISASRKKEWILPKGGWDTNELKEECAMRETYEEGGLVGLLGRCLDPIDYVSGKAKKSVLKELGDLDVEVREWGNVEGRLSTCHEGLRPPISKRFKAELPSLPTDPTLISSSAKRIVSSDSTLSTCSSGFNVMIKTTPAVASTVSCGTKNCSYIRLFLFPLYVSSVKSEWPEKGRLRKLVHIDEAIRIMDAQNRPYFRMGLEIVKERGLHLLMKSEQSDE